MTIKMLRGRVIEQRYTDLIDALVGKGIAVRFDKEWISFDVEDITQMLSAAWEALAVMSRLSRGDDMRTPWPFHVEGYKHTYFWRYDDSDIQCIRYGVLVW